MTVMVLQWLSNGDSMNVMALDHAEKFSFDLFNTFYSLREYEINAKRMPY